MKELVSTWQSQMKKWFPFMVLALSLTPALASIEGHVFKAEVLFPNSSTVVPGSFFPEQTCSGQGVEFHLLEGPETNLIGADFFSRSGKNYLLLTNVNAQQVTLPNCADCFYFRFSDANGTLPDITGVSVVDVPDTMSGFDESEIFFDADSIRIDFSEAGLTDNVWQTGELVFLEITLASTAPGIATTEFFFPQIGEGAVANINFSTQIALEHTNTGGCAAAAGGGSEVTIDFFATPDGTPMPVTIEGRGTATSFNIDLPPGSTVFLQTPGTTVPLQVGYARVTAPEGVSGLAIFQRQDDGTVVTKAGVPASMLGTDYSVPIDTTGANNTGLALVFPEATAAALSAQAAAGVILRLYDNDFNLLGTRNLNLNIGGHLPRLVTDADFFGDVAGVDEMTGSVTVQSDLPIAAVALLQDDDPLVAFPADVPILTAFPVIPGRADRGGAGAASGFSARSKKNPR